MKLNPATRAAFAFIEEIMERKEYLNGLAEDFGIDPGIVYMMADLLGPSEDYDGLISALEDYSEDL
jgi:hypothetical protein